MPLSREQIEQAMMAEPDLKLWRFKQWQIAILKERLDAAAKELRYEITVREIREGRY